MGFDLFQKIIDDASEIGVMRIHLYMHGEAMIHPRIIEMISYIKQKRLGISMHTNGTLFDREIIDKILKSGVNSGDYFIFSILGYSKEVHEGIMKGVNHDKIIYNVKQFKELRKKKKVNGPIVEVLFYRMAENQNEEEQFVKYWRRSADHVHPVGKISESFATYNRNDERERSFLARKKSCKLLWERMAVFWNGDVTICAEDLDGKHVIGNLGSSTIKEIWHGEKMKHIKRLHKEGVFGELSLCSRCDQ